jgi:hypothetical protein
MTDVYLDGKRIYLPLGGGLWSEELTFSSDKTYYDFVIDPGTSMDDKHHKGTKSYWRVSVTGKATSKAPSITKQPVVTSIYYKGQKATPLRVKAQSNDGGKLSYQWYSNTKASTSGAKAIKKATKATYTPTTKAANKVYYYFCKVTNTKSGIKKTSNSKVATVRVATNMNKKTVTIATNAKKTQVIEIPKSSKKANTQLALGKSKKAKNQTFVLVRDKNGYYQIKNSNSGMYLTVKGGKAKAKAAIVQAKKSASKAQKFKLGYNTGGNYLLVSALNSNYCIDLAKNSTGTGNKLILSKYSAKDKYQKFKIVAVKK